MISTPKLCLGALAVIAALTSSTVQADVPVDRPFSMRGVELGSTIEDFRQATIPDDEGDYEMLQTWCSNDHLPDGIRIEGDPDDQASGIVECQWFSKMKQLRFQRPTQHWINIGDGKGSPLFRFVRSDGQLRLFQITFRANSEYYPAILDALSRGYGAPKNTVEPFKTLAGGEFTSVTSVWTNRFSFIRLVQRCAHLERYCLSYTHTALAKPWLDMRSRRADEAASRI